MDTFTSVLPPAHLAGHAEPPSALNLNLDRLPELDALLPRLAGLSDAHLINLAVTARRMEACAFRLRGACVAELRRRARTRLTGGRGRRDVEGIGVKAQLTRLAARIGVGVSTLKTDARIHEVFFTNGEETRLACEPTLAREFYITALTAPDPHAAIRLAVAKRAAATDYSREDFRRDVSALKQSARPPVSLRVETASKPPDCSHVRVIPEARPVLAELVTHSDRTPEEVVAEALLAYHRSLTLPGSTFATKNQRRAAGTLKREMQPSLLDAPQQVA